MVASGVRGAALLYREHRGGHPCRVLRPCPHRAARCDAVLNVPGTHDGRVLVTLNLLHEAGWYGEADVAPGLLFAAFAVPGYLTLP